MLAQFGHARDDGDFAGGTVSVAAMEFLLFRSAIRMDVPAT
jgi:hypothetical protein